MSKRSKACDISAETRLAVKQRDGYRCIFCGNSNSLTIAHYIPRSKGGLGIEENLVTACANCHIQLDHGHGIETEMLQIAIRGYLTKLYPNFTDTDRTYRKWK